MNDQERLLTIFLRLQSGAHLAKAQLADEFGVSEKTIQRDFSSLFKERFSSKIFEITRISFLLNKDFPFKYLV